MTGCAAFKLQRSVLEYEWALLVRMALNARGVRTHGRPCLLLLKPAVRIMAVAAVHSSFEDFVMEGFAELSLGLVVTCHAQLRLICFQHPRCSLARVLRGNVSDECRRAEFEAGRFRTMC